MGIFSSGKGKVRRAAQQEETARNARYQQNATRINSVFDDPRRAAQQQDFLGALRAQYADQLGRGYTDAARQQKFAMAKRGLTGGSADVDSQRRLQEALTRGRLGAEAQAQGSFSDLVQQDENSRFGLLQAAQTGMNTGEAASRTASLMQRPTGGALPLLGNAFASFTDSLRQQKADAEYKRGASYDPWSA